MPRQHDPSPPPQPPLRSAEKETTPSPDHRGTSTYHIRLKGHLDARWSAWFDHMAITLEPNGDTLLSGPIVDQAALHGILTRVRDLGLPLVSVMEIDPAQPDGTNGSEGTHASQETNP